MDYNTFMNNIYTYDFNVKNIDDLSFLFTINRDLLIDYLIYFYVENYDNLHQDSVRIYMEQIERIVVDYYYNYKYIDNNYISKFNNPWLPSIDSLDLENETIASLCIKYNTDDSKLLKILFDKIRQKISVPNSDNIADSENAVDSENIADFEYVTKLDSVQNSENIADSENITELISAQNSNKCSPKIENQTAELSLTKYYRILFKYVFLELNV